MSEEKTFAEDLAEENERLHERFMILARKRWLSEDDLREIYPDPLDKP